MAAARKFHIIFLTVLKMQVRFRMQLLHKTMLRNWVEVASKIQDAVYYIRLFAGEVIT